jgi:archaemetzincin
MQGTASIAEDARQPPYLCPVDLAKVLRATGVTEFDRHRALLKFCKKHSDVQLFAAFEAWIESVLKEEERA